MALEHTIVVGRVYIQRMERTGMDRRDAGRTAAQPENLDKAETGRTPAGAGAQPSYRYPPKPERWLHNTIP